MAAKEYSSVLEGRDEAGKQTILYPITCLELVTDKADIKDTPTDGDYIPLIDGTDSGQMKKTPVSFFAKKPVFLAIRLATDGWTGNGPYTQTAAVPGAAADSFIFPCPAPESWAAAGAAGVRCSAQAADALTFVCESIPDGDLNYYVLIQEVR